MLESLSASFIDAAKTCLLAKDPHILGLQEALTSEFRLVPSKAKQVLYEVVRDLNGRLFPAITQLELIHTEGCNLACDYCFERHMLGYKKTPPEVARRAIDLLFDYSGAEEQVAITHFGGEPMANFGGIRLATEYAESKAANLGKAVRFDVTTNGTLLDEEKIDYLAEHKIMVLLSIDGLEGTHDRYRRDRLGRGSFRRTVSNMQLLKTAQPWIGIKMTVMPESVGNLFDDVSGLYNLGVNHFIIGHATGVEWPSTSLELFGDQLGKVIEWSRSNSKSDVTIDGFQEGNESYFGCQAGRTSIAVTIRGEISPCSKIMGLHHSRDLVGKLGDVEYGLYHLRNRFDLVDCGQLRSACETKGIADTFQGGCFAVNYAESGDMFMPSMSQHTISLIRRSACRGCTSCR